MLMRTMIQTLRAGVLLGMVLTATSGFAQTTTNTQPGQQAVSSEQVVTRTPKTEQPEKKIVTGCTEITRVTPANGENAGTQQERNTDLPERKVVTGCTELTRVKPAAGSNAGNDQTNETPVTIDRTKKN